jgi:hypothetical protein
MSINSTFFLGFFLFMSGTPVATHSPVPPVFHGIHIQVSARGGVHVARASYEGGTPVVSGDVTVMAPGSEEAWQTGRTDPSGRFAFVPDVPGSWTIQVDDGLGHRARATVQVEALDVAAEPEGESTARVDDTPAALPHSHSETGQGEPRLWQLLTGLGLIAGITGTAYGYTARRKGIGAG